jgi:hypothetical protein
MLRRNAAADLWEQLDTESAGRSAAATAAEPCSSLVVWKPRNPTLAHAACYVCPTMRHVRNWYVSPTVGHMHVCIECLRKKLLTS